MLKKIYKLFYNKGIIIIILLCIVSIPDCKKDNEDPVPYVYVDLYLNLSLPSYKDLTSPGNYIYITGGARGIVVYRVNMDEFNAFDRQCTYKVNEDNGQIAADTSGIFLHDAICGSIFIITDGSINKGPATVPLKRYQTSFDGTVLHIYN